MSEIAFAKSFLSTLDRRPVKLSSDHISDPRKYPAQSPYILPKQTHPFPARQRPSGTDTAKTVSVTLKPMRASSETLSLSSQPLDTTVLDVKTQYAQKSGLDVSKIKLLLNKRPAADLKTLKDVLPDPAPSSVEFTVMVLGGAGVASPSAPATPAAASPAVEIPDPTAKTTPMDIDEQKRAPAPLSERREAQHEQEDPHADTAKQVLATEEFWADLKDFLIGRLRDEGEGERLAGVFREASTR